MFPTDHYLTMFGGLYFIQASIKHIFFMVLGITLEFVRMHMTALRHLLLCMTSLKINNKTAIPLRAHSVS